MCYWGDTEYQDGTLHPTTVLEYIQNELSMDQMDFTNPLYSRCFEIAKQYSDAYQEDFKRFNVGLEERIAQFVQDETARLQQEEPDGLDSTSLINAQERKVKEITARANAVKAQAITKANNERQEFNCNYLMKILCSIDDDNVRELAFELAADNLPQLSKIHTQFAVILEEKDRLMTLVPQMIFNWKNAIVTQRINETKSQIAVAPAEDQPRLMEYLQELYEMRHQLAQVIGDRVVNPN